MDQSPDTVLNFWRDAGPAKWFRKDDAFDAEIKARFLALHESAASGQLTAWESKAETALAQGFDREFLAGERMFFYLPLEHSENLADQERCVALFRATGNADLLKW